MTEKSSPRRLLKVAQRIHDVLIQPVSRRVPTFSTEIWNELEALARRLQIASERNWAAALLSLREHARYCVRRLERRLADWLEEIPIEERDDVPVCIRDIHADLLALDAEFEQFEFDLKEGTLSVVTEPVVLKGVDLGRFEIVLRWKDIGSDSAYEVVSLDGQASGSDSTTTHPHVRDDRLCEGEGQPAIRAALRSGRLFDFFVLLRQVLQTYNPHSAYVPLEKWNGRECRDCGETVPEDESTCCERCDRDLCFECGVACRQCKRDCCANCRVSCESCGGVVCDRCAESCGQCSESVCPDCLQDGTCDACRREERESDETIPETTAPEAETLRPEAALYAVCVGEAPVPA